ncbi:MAG: hypothetical protein ACOC7U_07750 [Spirochaetota bacterium]
MSECKFNDPYYISMYYEGKLSGEDEKAFSRHLLRCRKCLEALLNLQNDLFTMFSVAQPCEVSLQKTRVRKPIFKLLSDGIMLLTGGGQYGLAPVPLLASRGKITREVCGHQVYKMKSNDIEIELSGAEGKLFNIEIRGASGDISLYREQRMVEARADVSPEGIKIYNLQGGVYTLFINEEKMLEFVVI